MTIESINGNNVISLGPRRAELSFPAVKEVEAYWDGLRDGRPVPSRADIDPRGMQGALEFAFILERIAPGVARFRLAGMHLTDLMGMEVRGMPLTAIFVPEARRQISEALEGVFETPQVTVVTLKSAGGVGRPALEAQLLLCPLKSDLGDVNRILGCLQSKGDIGRQPRRFDVVEVNSTPLVTDMPAMAKSTPAVEPTARDTDTAIPATETAPAKAPAAPSAKDRHSIPGFEDLRKAVEERQEGKASDAKAPKAAKRAHLRLVTNNDG